MNPETIKLIFQYIGPFVVAFGLYYLVKPVFDSFIRNVDKQTETLSNMMAKMGEMHDDLKEIKNR